MLRKTLITLTAIAALTVGSTAMAMHGGGGGGHGGGWGGGGGHGWGGGGGRGWGGGGAGFAAAHGPMMHAGPMATAPTTGGRSQGWSGRTFSRTNTAWGVHDHFAHFHDRFHHRFHHRNFFAFGFGGPIYDYANSCWTQVPTRYGWRWVYVCGDYGYY